MGFQIAHFAHAGPGSVVLPLDYGAIGSATAMAVGVALARPSRLTVLGVGDGGLMMTLGDLDTAVRAGVALLVLVLNDRAYGAEVQILRVKGHDGEIACFPDRSFADIASSLGAEGMTIRELSDVTRLGERLRAPLDGVLVVDCAITRSVRAEFVDSAALVR
jgi:thiamine pyrophosphate-dependent acetolactate synthase large subunit-like protein